jgi:hypothetical protein
MNSCKPIGGFFELELPPYSLEFLHAEHVLLASGRNCLEFILRSHDIMHVYLSKYTCDAVLEVIKRLRMKYSFYMLNRALEVEEAPSLAEGEVLLYNNYFGIKDAYCRSLNRTYGYQLILDCSHAFFFAPPKDCHTFYSPRKFLGVPDGGIAVTDRTLSPDTPVATSFDRGEHLLKRIDLGPEAAYPSYTANEKRFGGPVMQMSQLTRALLGTIDYNRIRRVRNSNFGALHELLGAANLLPVEFTAVDGPLAYPYWSRDPMLRQRLIGANVFVARYWDDVLDRAEPNELEYELVDGVVPLPVDQRYTLEDMTRVAGLVNAG